MTNFLIYLFESGLCLTLFYFGYVLFFRKETYFNFNRFYLLASLVLSALMPLISIDMDTGQTGFSSTIHQISSFKNYYEELILLTDPDYAVSRQGVHLQDLGTGSMAMSAISSWNISGIVFSIYLAGLLFFTLRLLVLIYQLFKYIRNHKTIEFNGVHLVALEDNVPSFSFLRWVFLNKHLLNQVEFEQVLAHEKVHVQHKHSLDLLLAQLITLLQWFNPLTWRIQKSMKTCHEYIADRKVIEQGHELFDYQSLLLSQLISIRSVELVNNFNLLSIKKRIAMMNKSKSGRIAKLKAFLVIPILSFAFLFFANMTEGSIGKSGDKLFVSSSVATTQTANQPVNIPTAKEVKTYDSDFILCTITLTPKGLFYNGVAHDITKVNEFVESISLPSDKDKARKMSVLLKIDASVKMKEVDLVRHALRKHDLLKIGFATKANNTGEQTALFMLLPPKDMQMMEEDEVDHLYEIKSLKGDATNAASKKLSAYIKGHEKYIMTYKYDNQTTYGNYLATVDMVFHTVNNLRREAAKKNQKEYDVLSSQEQKQYKKQYPITLVSNNLDMDL